MWNSRPEAGSSLQVDDAVLAQTMTDLQVCLPAEGVGLWAGHDEQVTAWLPLQNVAENARVRYAVQPQQWLDALRQVRERGLQAMAVVHSHPTAPAVPSARDRAEWHYPELWCVIVSFADREPVWQAYNMQVTLEE